MKVRAARAADGPALVALYGQWGHAQPEEVVADRIATWEATASAKLLVAAMRFYAALGYDDQSSRQARFARDLHSAGLTTPPARGRSA